MIAYTGFDDRFQGHQTTMLYLMDRAGGPPRPLTTGLDRDIEGVEWIGNSALIIRYDDRGDSKVARCSLDGKVEPLAEHLGGTGAPMAARNFSMSSTDRFAFNYSTPKVPGDVGVGTVGNPSRIITDVSRDLMSQRKLGDVEEIQYASSKDQRPIQAWIVKPPDFDPSRKYPLILEIHGGPFANYGDRFDVEKQVWSGKGYVLLYANLRGSTSYGEEFANLIHHAYPGDDFYDLNSGVDASWPKATSIPKTCSSLAVAAEACSRVG